MLISRTLALIGLLTIIGCQAESSTLSSGSFHVDGATGIATGESLGIAFEVAGADSVQSMARLESGKPENTSALISFTLADDAVIQLVMVERGEPIQFRFNDKDYGNLEEGDTVVIDESRVVTVNGATRSAL